MNKFIKQIDKLKISASSKPGKRFVACVIDMTIVFFVAILVFSGVFKITENTMIYKNEEKIVKEEIQYYNDFIKETHIVEFVDNIRVDKEVILKIYDYLNKFQ